MPSPSRTGGSSPEPDPATSPPTPKSPPPCSRPPTPTPPTRDATAPPNSPTRRRPDGSAATTFLVRQTTNPQWFRHTPIKTQTTPQVVDAHPHQHSWTRTSDNICGLTGRHRSCWVRRPRRATMSGLPIPIASTCVTPSAGPSMPPSWRSRTGAGWRWMHGVLCHRGRAA